MIDKMYDFIILGAGTSGCFLAEKLSRDECVNVLLVEAGSLSKNPVFSMPAGFTQTLFDKKYNWCFNSAPETQLNDREIYCPRGKVVGGSSMINGMIHSIGQKEDYDGWVEEGFSLSSSKGVMSKFGELFPEGEAITRAEPHSLEPVFLSACKEAGLPCSADLHRSQSTRSAGPYYHTTKKGRRNGVNSILPILRNRKNVTLLTRTHIDTLQIENDKVTKINALYRGKKACAIDVGGEVIVCLGSIGSPAVLQRSGIGSQDKLKRVGIKTAIDLPTGENLQDHLLVKLTYKLSGVRTYNSDASGMSLTKTLWDYSVNRKGPLAAGASSLGAFVSVGEEDIPDTQIFFSYGSGKNSTKALVVDPFDAITIGSYQLRPESRGSVSIRSADPMASPLIHYNYLSTKNDWHLAKEGLKFQESLMNRSAFSPFNPEALVTDLSHEDYIRQFAETAHHPVGTCAVGENGVVDGDLAVKGLKNLRIADASVIPRIISGNTQAICAVIGDLLGEELLSRSQYV